MDIGEQNRYIGLDKWHNAGYKGQAVNVWNTEGASDHSDIVTRRIKDAAPLCNVFVQAMSSMSNAEIEAFIKINKIKILTRSTGGSGEEGGAWSLFWKGLKEKYNLILFNSGGNDSDNSSEFGGGFPPDVALYIGACILFAGKPKMASYSSQYAQIDFVTFTGLWNGTSFASPYMAGQAAVYVQRYGDITQSQIVELFARNVIPIEGMSGYGLPTMGDVAEGLPENMNGKLLLEKYVLTSPFGMRTHPVTGIKTFHNGTDYATSGSPPIFSPFAGTVKKVATDQYGAKYVYIDYGAYVGLAYHCSKIIVSAGQKIIKGQIIGYCGNTGRSTGEHLHWSWIVNNDKAMDYYGASYVDWEKEIMNKEEIEKMIKDALQGGGVQTPSDWAKDAWSTAKSNGITDGTNPKGYLTREQMILMLSRALK